MCSHMSFRRFSTQRRTRSSQYFASSTFVNPSSCISPRLHASTLSSASWTRSDTLKNFFRYCSMLRRLSNWLYHISLCSFQNASGHDNHSGHVSLLGDGMRTSFNAHLGVSRAQTAQAS